MLIENQQNLLFCTVNALTATTDEERQPCFTPQQGDEQTDTKTDRQNTLLLVARFTSYMTSTIKRDPIVKLVLFQSHFHLYKHLIVERKLMWIIKQTFKSSFQAFSLCLGGFLQLLSPLRRHHLTVQKNGRRAREREGRKWQP